MKILLLTPPMTQLNTPYPATAYLTGFLRKEGYSAYQADIAIELVLSLFSKTGLNIIFRELQKPRTPSKRLHECVSFFMDHASEYLRTIDPVVRFLQGKDPSLALRIVSRTYLPEGPRFGALVQEEISSQDSYEDGIAWAFGSLGVQDRAKYLASLFIDDLADVIREAVDSRFELSRYGEKLAASVPTFDCLEEALQSSCTLVDQTLDRLTLEKIQSVQPHVVGITVPFPGNAYGAFRMAQVVKRNFPKITVILGGGYANTELRQISDPRVFDYVDYITLDDGEKPLLCVLEHLKGKRTQDQLFRTFVRQKNQGTDSVIYKNDPTLHDIPLREAGIPTYDGLPLEKYLSLFEMLNPVHRIWSDGRWNKVTLAHGCYWKKCNFCDVSLDYIQRYEPSPADLVVEKVESLIRETGQTGFHFVDEAAPPALLRAFAEKILQKEVSISWWGNVRFDKAFTSQLTQILAQSGCVAVTGGLEVASDRLLKLMQKGVTVEQVARVTHAFTNAGIMVHAYLMYGFPTQTLQETVDSLERVRQLFEEGCLQSAYWHRFSATAHSPIGLHPEKYGIRILPEPEVSFARNDLAFEDPTGCSPEVLDALGEALRTALYNYMLGVGVDQDVRLWFKQKCSGLKIPKPKVDRDLVRKAISR